MEREKKQRTKEREKDSKIDRQTDKQKDDKQIECVIQSVNLYAPVFNVGPHGKENLRQLEISGGTSKRQQTFAFFRCFVDGVALLETKGALLMIA